MKTLQLDVEDTISAKIKEVPFASLISRSLPSLRSVLS